MNITMRKSSRVDTLRPAHPWDVAIVGDVLDDRGQAAVDFATQNSGRAPWRFRYEPDDLQIIVDSMPIGADSVDGFFAAHRNAKVLLDTTTLGFVEVFLCCRAMRQLGFPGVAMTYVEPGEYRRPKRSQLLHKREFELTSVQPGFRAIPGATLMLDDKRRQDVVFFLGYEDHRLSRALQDSPSPARWSVVFGVPAFQAGWEMDAFANNVTAFRQQTTPPDVLFCGAENPLGAYNILADHYDLCLDSRHDLFVAPVGTKPHGIGVALFVAEHPGVGILYDHPRRAAQRSSRTLNFHLFEAVF